MSVEPSQDRVRVLVADDSLEDRAVLKRYLTRGDDTFEVRTAETGAEAMDVFRAFRPHCILVDYNLPDCDGLELLSSLLDSAPKGERPVAIVLTGQGDERVAVGAMKAGAADYIVKADLAPEFLCERVRQALRKADLERALERSRDSFRSLVESAADAILVSRHGRIVYVNRTLVEWLGYGAEDLLGRVAAEAIVHPDESSVVQNRVERATVQPLGFQLPRRTLKLRRQDGGVALGDTVTVNAEFEGELASISVIRDVTEKQKLEQRVRQSERLASMGTLAAGVAHEINNPLAGIMANMEYVLDELREVFERSPDLEDTQEALQESLQAAERIRKIVKGMKSFSRADAEEPSPLDLVDVLEVAIGMSRTEVRHRATLVKDYGSLPPVFADEGRLAQVFINLIVNAAQCYPAGDAANHPIHLVTRTDPDGNAMVEVTDEGPGIPEEMRSRIFDPFFTTKDTGEGTGLGLSIAHGLIESAGGSLVCESEMGHGTTFRVVLPPMDEAAEGPGEGCDGGHADPHPTTTRSRVLVIDDEVIVGSAVRRALQKDHDVHVFQDAREALARVEAGDRYEAIFCDLMMPKVTGMEFFRRLQESAPAQAERVIFMTGGAFTPEARVFVDQLDRALLEKPFAAGAIREALQTLLEPVA